MLFEVIKDDQVVACTDQICCIYDDAQLKDIQSAGFTFGLNGEKASIKAIKAFRNSNQKLIRDIFKAGSMKLTRAEIEKIMDEEMAKDPSKMDGNLVELCLDVLSAK